MSYEIINKNMETLLRKQNIFKIELIYIILQLVRLDKCYYLFKI